jgi:carbon-monoxide dehydrogenase large subunit
MDYALARATDVPSYNVSLTEDPTYGNPLRVKGGGEGGITPAAAAVINAVVDALRSDGVEDIAMPATPETIWRALQDARRNTQREEISALRPSNPSTSLDEMMKP